MSGRTSCVAMSTAAAAAMLRCCYGDESQLTLGSLWQVRARRDYSVTIFWHRLASLPSTRKHRQHDPPGRMIFSTTKTETKINGECTTYSDIAVSC